MWLCVNKKKKRNKYLKKRARNQSAIKKLQHFLQQCNALQQT